MNTIIDKCKMREIEEIFSHYENYLIKFKGDKNHYFFDIKKLKGIKLSGSLIKKRVRVWFE